jgi:ribose 5-phosphate isomerase A
MDPKKIAAEKAIGFVRDGMLLGLGTGSTAYWAILAIAEKVREQKLNIQAIATSIQSEKLARESGISIVAFDKHARIDLTIDGADEVNRELDLIKGGGGALLREKIVAYNSRQLIIIVDESKLVAALGRFPLPVEIAVFGWEITCEHLASLGCKAELRMKEGKPFLSDNGHYIIDCHFHVISDPGALNSRIREIPGVMETGLFVQMANKVIVGYGDGHTEFVE